MNTKTKHTKIVSLLFFLSAATSLVALPMMEGDEPVVPNFSLSRAGDAGARTGADARNASAGADTGAGEGNADTSQVAQARASTLAVSEEASATDAAANQQAVGATEAVSATAQSIAAVAVPALLTLEDFRNALEANPDAIRFRINNEAGMLSLQALNTQQALNEASTRRPEAISGENVEVTSALQAALAAEYPEIDVANFFVVNPMTTIIGYTSLSAERIDNIFQRLDILKNPPANSRANHSPFAEVQAVPFVRALVAEPIVLEDIDVIPQHLSIETLLEIGVDEDVLRSHLIAAEVNEAENHAGCPWMQRKLKEVYVSFLNERNRDPVAARLESEANIAFVTAKTTKNIDSWHTARNAALAANAHWSGVTEQREAEMRSFELHRKASIKKEHWAQKAALADTMATAVDTRRNGLVTWRAERHHAKKVCDKAKHVWAYLTTAIENFNSNKTNPSEIRFDAVRNAAALAARAVHAAALAVDAAVHAADETMTTTASAGFALSIFTPTAVIGSTIPLVGAALGVGWVGAHATVFAPAAYNAHCTRIELVKARNNAVSVIVRAAIPRASTAAYCPICRWVAENNTTRKWSTEPSGSMIGVWDSFFKGEQAWANEETQRISEFLNSPQFTRAAELLIFREMPEDEVAENR